MIDPQFFEEPKDSLDAAELCCVGLLVIVLAGAVVMFGSWLIG